jgi:hypothetical protein
MNFTTDDYSNMTAALLEKEDLAITEGIVYALFVNKTKDAWVVLPKNDKQKRYLKMVMTSVSTRGFQYNEIVEMVEDKIEMI